MDSSIFWGTAWRPNSQYARFPFFHLQTSNVNFWLKPLGLYNFVTGVLGGAYKILKGTYIRGGVISGLKKRFKTSYKAVLIKILFELTHFFKLHQNIVKIRIHFNTSLREAFVQGFVTWCIFCLQVDRLRAVSYISLQSYCTRNLSKPRAARNEGVSPRKNLVSVGITSWFAIALDEIITWRILREKADCKQSSR